MHKQIFVVPSASLEIYTVSSCTIRFQNAPLPKGREAISVAVCACACVCYLRVGLEHAQVLGVGMSRETLTKS
jgi:hypothetical protein